MAVKRPWVLPNDVKSYTSHKEVSERSDEKLTFDIARAEMKIIHITNNKFAEYDEIPEPVKMAVILVAEAYAKNDIEAAKKKIKSESFDDYSYTVEAGTISLDRSVGDSMYLNIGLQAVDSAEKFYISIVAR